MGLEIQIQNVRASGPPSRSLELEFSIQSNSDGLPKVAILNAWIKVTFQGVILVEGPYIKQCHAPSGKATFPGSGYGVIFIPLTTLALESIERERKGDLELRIESRVLAAQVREIQIGGKSVPILEASYETVFMVKGLSPIIYSVAQSEWIKLLTQLKWSALELFEIPLELFSSDPNLKRAIELLREAQNRFLRGDWTGVLQNCRQAFEAAAADIGQAGDKANKASNFQKLLDRVGGGKKSERLNDIVKSLSDYCHLGRHEDFPAVNVTREDARAMLRCSLSIFSLLGGRVD